MRRLRRRVTRSRSNREIAFRRVSPAPLRLPNIDRKALLLGTALASTLILSSLLAPAPAAAVVTCAGDVGTGPAPIDHTNGGAGSNDSIVCINTEARTNAAGDAIDLSTVNADHYIHLNSNGTLTATNGGNAAGIYTRTNGSNSPIDIVNAGDIVATGTGAYGIVAATLATDSAIDINNGGDFTISASGTAGGIGAQTYNGNSKIEIKNSGDFTVSSTGAYGFGIFAQTSSDQSPISIENAGNLRVIANDDAFGIFARTSGIASPIAIENSGNIVVQSTGLFSAAFGIAAETVYGDITIKNTGDVTATGAPPLGRAIGISAQTVFGNIAIFNSGAVTSSYYAIATRTLYGNTHIENSGPLRAGVDGIYATAELGNIDILNTGDIAADVHGIHAYAGCGCYGTTDISITNTAKIDAGVIGILAGGGGTHIAIQNKGDVTAGYAGIFAFTGDDDSGIAISNSAKITAGSVGIFAATGVYDTSCGCSNIPDLVPTGYGANSPISIVNSGSVHGGNAGIIATSAAGTTIVNTGTISAGTNFAIGVFAGPAKIYNSGTITGYVLLDADDTFLNQKGGTFEARQTSDFDAFGTGGIDLFQNQQGATVHAVAVNGTQPSFVNLERFENQGMISTVNDSVGDIFRISNTIGGTNLSFVASNGSTLAVDAFLGRPGSTADNFIVDGSVSGKTELQVVDVNPGPGVLNKQVIPVVFVNGNVNPNAFFLKEPIDTGFFDYDLFFDPSSGGGGVFSLRSFLGQGAFVLPQLKTAAQDLWADGAETWFDRTADLRVLLNGGMAPAEADSKLGESRPLAPQITPAVWVRAGGSSLDRDASAGVSAFGNSYKFNLDRNLEAFNFEGGIDFGKRDLFAFGDILVFGVLGGGVASTLDYDKISRQFDLSGGEAGAYATYLKGGLFVDTLFKADLLTLDPKHETGFPGTLSANTFGLRTDSGYRFGGFHGGPFLEPLATIAVIWADLDGFSQGGNTMSFNDDPNVRGRLGLRLGTDYPVWTGTTMEPFVIGSLWGNLSDNNQATLNSLGTTFQLEDKLQDVWGEVSGGVNFFNPSANTSAFAKVDVAFGNDIDGISGKAGMRVSW